MGAGVKGECLCQKCRCPILDHEERAMQSMTGKFGCLLLHWHEHDRSCVRALLGRVKRLEKELARLNAKPAAAEGEGRDDD